jgi:hypothetical protein
MIGRLLASFKLCLAVLTIGRGNARVCCSLMMLSIEPGLSVV